MQSPESLTEDEFEAMKTALPFLTEDKFEAMKTALPELMKVSEQQLPKPASGFTVGTEVRMTTDGRGLGVFATEFIPAGTQIYEDRDDEDEHCYDEVELLHLLEELPNREEKVFFLDHCWCTGCDEDDEVEMAVNDTIFINHSRKPTVLYVNINDDVTGYAVRDLYPGEEITEDYRKYEGLSFLRTARLEHDLDYSKFL